MFPQSFEILLLRIVCLSHIGRPAANRADGILKVVLKNKGILWILCLVLKPIFNWIIRFANV